jgi:hypothetical protein
MTDIPAAGPAPAGDPKSAPVTVITQAETAIAKPPNWFISRLSEKTSQAAIASVGSVWCGVGAAAVMGMGIRPLIAAAIPITFSGVLAFLYKESPAAITIDAPAIEQSPAAIVRAA